MDATQLKTLSSIREEIGEKMNQIVKLIGKVVIGASLIGLIIAAAACSSAKQSTAEAEASKVAEAASRIADFTLPDGYKEEYNLSVGAYSVAGYNPGDQHSHLVFVQGPKDMELDEDALRKASGTYDRTTRLTVIETKAAQVRGQEVTLLISEGTNSDGDAYRELSVAFQGKGGPALMVIEEPVSRWNQEKIESFVASIQ